MSNIEKIRQEIENSIEAFEFNGGIYDPYEAGELSAYKEILDFIDSLSEEKPSEDLEEAADKFAVFMKGVAEGRRLEREEREENKRKEDDLPRYYGD